MAGLLVPISAAGGATAQPDVPTPGPAELPRAEIYRPIGVANELIDDAPGKAVRVAIILNRQPVLEETTDPSFEAALSGYTRGDLQRAARRSPEGVSRLEARAATASERRRTKVISGLEPEIEQIEDAQALVERAVERAGGNVAEGDLATTGPLTLVTARVDRGELDELAARGDVQAILAAPKPEPELNTSTTTIGANSVWPQHNGGADSDGPAGGAADVRSIEVGMAGDPPNPSHPAFAGITIDNGASSGGAHGTATTGIIASRDGTFRGVAPGISAVRGGGGADDWSDPDPVEVRNESFGFDPDGDHDADVADLAANTFLVPWAASAGNRNDDPDVTPATPTTGGDAMGRNIVSTGAIADISTLNEADDAVAIYSGWGPTPGGRKKPDLVAPGTAITTTSVGGGFGTETGTSLAAPHAAGGLAILAGAGMTDPRAMRATLINSASPWCNGHVPGHDPPQGPTLVDDPNYGTEPGAGVCQTGWEPDVGWGELDVANAIAQRGNAVIGDVEAGKARFYRATVDPAERTTLAWNMRGVLGQFVHEHVYFATTDLNLRQYRPDGAEIMLPTDPGWGAGPDAVDANDTVEQVRAPDPGGELIYKVSADSTVEGQAAERFGLASANVLTALESPDVAPSQVSRSGAGPINCSETVTVTARLANPSSDIETTASSLTLELPAGLELISGTATQSVSGATLAVDETSEQVSWTVRANGSGNHAPAVRGQGTAYGTTFTNREQLGSIAADCTPPRVEPTGLSVAPSSEVECGAVQTVSTSFRNPTITDASGARAEISPTNAELVSGPVSQAVSAGTLSAGATSAPHSWGVRILSPTRGSFTSATVTITGRSDLNSQPSTAQLNLRCNRSAAPQPEEVRGTVRLVEDKLNFKRDQGGRLVASGRLDGSTSKRVSGKIDVEFVHLDARRKERGKGRKTKTKRAVIERDGSFKANLKSCRKGEHKAFAEYPGSDHYKRLGRTKIGEKERVRGC